MTMRVPPVDQGLPIQCEVLRIIERTFPASPTIESVAAALSMNIRTLQRRLKESDVSFRNLLDECRARRAIRYLEDGELTVTQISTMLGYSEPAHFCRAFRRWTGHRATNHARKTSVSG